MRIAVCDDCMEDALSLKKYLGWQEVFMEESMNGIELAKELRRLQEEAVICFVSASDDFYREAYDLYAFQYLIKPVGEESEEAQKWYHQ